MAVHYLTVLHDCGTESRQPELDRKAMKPGGERVVLRACLRRQSQDTRSIVTTQSQVRMIPSRSLRSRPYVPNQETGYNHSVWLR